MIVEIDVAWRMDVAIVEDQKGAHTETRDRCNMLLTPGICIAYINGSTPPARFVLTWNLTQSTQSGNHPQTASVIFTITLSTESDCEGSKLHSALQVLSPSWGPLFCFR